MHGISIVSGKQPSEQFVPAGTGPRAQLLCGKRRSYVPHSPQPPKDYPAEKARQGQIILRTRTQRAIFIAGLAGAVLLALVLGFAGAFGP